ncbi:MAG: hypothetical protein ACRCXC_09730 [Legionella sp.]
MWGWPGDWLTIPASNLAVDLSLYLENLSPEVLDDKKTIENIRFLLPATKVPAILKDALKSILFFASTHENTRFLSGKILEHNLFPYSAAILYASSGKLAFSKSTLNKLKGSQLSAVYPLIIDFAAIIEDEHLILKDALLSQQQFYQVHTQLMNQYLQRKLDGGDYLDALNHYLMILHSLYKKGWPGSDALFVYTKVFNILVNVLLHFELLIPIINQYETSGYTFCVNLAKLLDLTFEPEMLMRSVVPMEASYLAARTQYFVAFHEQCNHFGINTMPSDAHFAAYWQLHHNQDIDSPEKILDAMSKLGKFKALITASTYLDQSAFHSVINSANRAAMTL